MVSHPTFATLRTFWVSVRKTDSKCLLMRWVSAFSRYQNFENRFGRKFLRSISKKVWKFSENFWNRNFSKKLDFDFFDFRKFSIGIQLFRKFSISKISDSFQTFFKSISKKNLLKRFSKFWYLEKVEIVSFHEHLKSFNSTDSSLSYRTKRGCDTI